MKTCEEWSLEFDLLYNNIMSNQAPGLTEYEKSVFLTRAQNAVIIMLYNGTLRHSFEETEEVTDYLSALVKQSTMTVPESDSALPHIVSSSVIYKLPEDFLFRTFEKCAVSSDEFSCEGGSREVIVTPVTQDEFWRTSHNPFKRQNKRKVLRLAFDNGAVTSGALSTDSYSELVSDYTIDSYTLRYIRKPDPIILETLTDGTSIDGQTLAMPCKLNEHLHQTILTEAVNAAKSVWR